MPRLARHSRAGSDGTPKSPTACFASASALLVLFLFLLLASALLDEPSSIALQPLGAKLPLHFNLRVVRAPFTYLTMAFAVVARELSCFAHRLLVAPITFLSSLVSHDLSHPVPLLARLASPLGRGSTRCSFRVRALARNHQQPPQTA
ncbi:hypothetical protein J3E68DRAFT_405585 [Trichoderma sp. SZMC 28012]